MARERAREAWLSDGSEALGYAGGLLEGAKGGEKESGRACEGSGLRAQGVKSREGEYQLDQEVEARRRRQPYWYRG